MVRTSPFHGGNRGSNPLGVTEAPIVLSGLFCFKLINRKIEILAKSVFGLIPSTTISWHSPVDSWQTLKIYDLLGREIATLVNEYKPAGVYEVEFNPGNLSSGIYFYRFTSGNFIETKKLILLR
jgi:hypothetical protein